MNIRVKCPNPECGEFLTVDETHAGREGKCPECGHVFVVPDV